MPPRVVRNLKLPPLDRSDSLLAGVDARHLAAFDPDRAAGHVSPSLLHRHGTARLFVADALLTLWGQSMTPVAGDKRLGCPHLLNDPRFRAVMSALEEYSPRQIAAAIRAYAAHCRENRERQANPWMRKTFEAFLKDVLETWVTVGNKDTARADREQQQVADLREHRDFLAAWSQLPPDRQTALLRQAGSTFSGTNPTTSNPAFRAVLQKLMERGSEETRKEEPKPELPPSILPPSSTESDAILAVWDGLSRADQAKLLAKADKRLAAQGKFPGRIGWEIPIVRRKVCEIIRQDLRKKAAESQTTNDTNNTNEDFKPRRERT
jgi:hypothetical protein